MIPTPLNPDYKIRHNVRPIKRAYFVPENDIEAARRVLRYVCTEWGGINNLIIPIRPDFSIPPLFKTQLQFHEPDQFITFAMSSREADREKHWIAEEEIRQLFPWRSIQIQFHDVFVKYDTAMHPLGVIPPSWSKPLITHRFEGPEADDWLLLATFGAIYRGQESSYEKDTFLNQVKVGIDTPNFWTHQFNSNPFGSVLNLTSYGVRPYEVENSGESNHFDVVLVNSIPSLCMFWNLRADREVEQFHKETGRRTLLLPEKLLTNRQALNEMVHFVHKSLPHKYLSTNLHLRFCAWDESDQRRLKTAIKGLDLLKRFAEKKITVRYKHGQPTDDQNFEEGLSSEVTYTFGIPPTAVAYREGVGPKMAVNTELRYGSNEILFSPPDNFYNNYGQMTALDTECDVWQRYPKDHRVADTIVSSGWFSRYGFTYLTTPPTRTTYVNVALPTEWESIKLYFSARGYEVKQSKNGSYANGVIGLIGGIENIDLLAREPVYRLLDALALKSTKKLSQRIIKTLGLPENSESDIQKLIADIEIVPELKRIPKTFRQLVSGVMQPDRSSLLSLLTQLSEMQVIKRGFHLPCPHCGTPSWYPLQVIQEIVLCPGCSRTFPLPVEHPRNNEIQWEYTLNTLVNRAMDQDSLPPAFALRHLTKKTQACCLTLGLELIQAREVKAELDFLLVSNQKISAGECKAGTEIGDKDIETARIAAGLGIERFYYCTISRFSKGSVQRISKLQDEFNSKNITTRVSSLCCDQLFDKS